MQARDHAAVYIEQIDNVDDQSIFHRDGVQHRQKFIIRDGNFFHLIVMAQSETALAVYLPGIQSLLQSGRRGIPSFGRIIGLDFSPAADAIEIFC